MPIIETRISSSADDAEEFAGTGRTALGSTDLDLGFPAKIDSAGMRFNGIDIPQGAVITNAYIQFQAEETGSGFTSLEIWGEDTDNAQQFTTTTDNITSRQKTSSSVIWEPGDWDTVGEAGADQRTGDLSSIIQEIVSRSGWQTQNSLVFITKGTGGREAESYDGDASAAPLLHIEYSFPNTITATVQATSNAEEPNTDGLFTVELSQTSTSDTTIGYTISGTATPNSQPNGDYQALSGTVTILAGELSAEIPVAVIDDLDSEGDETVTIRLNSTVTSGDPDIVVNTNPATITIQDNETPTNNTQTFESRVSNSADDAEELSSSGGIKLSSTDIDLGFEAKYDSAGMRFNGIDIPQGAIITNAYIQFQAEETGTGSTSLEFWGEDTDNALQFSSASGNISSRQKTNESVTWEPSSWNTVGEAGTGQRTSDLSSIVQEIIDRPGWQQLNSLVIIASGTGGREAESYDGDASAAPLLHIEWRLPDGSAPTNFEISGTQVFENSAEGTIIGSLGNVTDTDAGDSHTFSLVNDAGGRFKIVGNELQVDNGTLLNFESQPTHNVTIRVHDTAGWQFDKTFTLNINDVNEAPYLLTPIADISSQVNNGLNFNISGNFADEDTSHGDVLTYSATLENGNNLPSWLNFNSTSGLFSGTPTPSEVGNLNVTVTARDSSGSPTVSDTFQLSVVESGLVQVVEAFNWTPPSSDSAGIIYLEHTGSLLLSDSEINETSLFTGDNLFNFDLDGQLDRNI